MTGKDAVKIRQNPEIAQDKRIWVVDLETQLDTYFVQFVLERVFEAARRKNIDVVPLTEEITH